VLTSYSLHYVGGVGTGDISADYYSVYCRRLESLLGVKGQEPPPVVMMANGTSGDVNNIDFVHPRPRQEPYAQIRLVAEDVAGKVHQALTKAAYRDDVTLAAAYREPAIGVRLPTAEERAWATKTLADAGPKPPQGNLSVIYAQRIQHITAGPTMKVPLQVLRIGDVCIATMPCEVFCEIGLEFKKRSPLPSSFLVSLAHGYLGYLPTPAQHVLGGYETWLGTCQLEPRASEKMLDALREMAAEVRGGSQ
jgi:hypothetical protein